MATNETTEKEATDEATEKEATNEATPIEAAQGDVQADLSELINEVRALAQQALDECKELRAVITEEAMSEAASVDVLDGDIEPEDLRIDDLLA